MGSQITPLGGSATPYVEFLDVTKVYKDFRGSPVARGIEGLSFAVRQGETLAILGPNGAGKTTVLKLLSGLVIPTQGRIKVGGFDMIREREKALQHVGVMLGDARSVYWRLTVRDNLEYFGVLRGVYGKKLRQRIAGLAELLDFEDVLNRRAGELSRGMRQRLLLAIALLPDPQLLILDEPTFGLDVASRYEIRNFLREVALQRRRAIVIATHQMDEAQALASHVCVLRRGKVVTLNTTQDLIRKTGGVRDKKTASSSWLEGVFLELTSEARKERAEISHDGDGYPLG